MKPRIVPESWLVPARARRVILHWTAGGPAPSDLDLSHYHLLLTRAGKLIRGEHAISDNDSTADDDYAAHTRGCNTGAVGIALCGMLGATQHPFKPGPYPLTRPQWNAALLAAADVCERYAIPVDREHLLMHCEVESFLGNRQTGKWDISILPFDRGPWADLTPGEELRKRVALLLQKGG